MTLRESVKERTSRLAWLIVDLDDQIQRAAEAGALERTSWLTQKREAMRHRRSLLLRRQWHIKGVRREARRQAAL